MTDPTLFDNLDRGLLPPDDPVLPDVSDPLAELWWRPVQVVDTGGRT